MRRVSIQLGSIRFFCLHDSHRSVRVLQPVEPRRRRQQRQRAQAQPEDALGRQGGAAAGGAEEGEDRISGVLSILMGICSYDLLREKGGW